tara:strand:- start:10 stop:687 length:678 start_codon:yes stop_codon:yes gene_type:complete
MAYTYLDITNEVIARFNEVALTASNFSASRGFQTQCKNAINDAIDYINTSEYSWPFNHATSTDTLVAGTTRYSINTTSKHVDYTSFRLVKDDSLSCPGGKLKLLDYKDYMEKHISQEDDSTVGSVPVYVFRTPENKYGLYPYPDKAYSLRYEYFNYVTPLSAQGDVPSIPEQYRSVIVDGATSYGYQYRGETQQHQLNFQRFEAGIKHMRTLLINRTYYLRSTVL